MTTSIIITFCILILIAYIFDLTSAKTRIPSVILLLLLGWLVQQAITFFGIAVPDLSPVLPLLGSVGLILIVLEGSLELEFNRSKFPLIKSSFFGALLPMLVLPFILAFLFQQYGHYTFRNALINAIPLCVISSSIAIPSARNLLKRNKEFIIYESSFSDIIGVLLFNFLTLNTVINLGAFTHFGVQLLIITAVSFIATIMLSFLLKNINHNIKFVPIIIMIVFTYEISKVYHLPALIFILFFGLFISNLDELKGLKWIQRLKPEVLNREAAKLRELTAEGTFLIRTLFFLLFGYMIEAKEVQNRETLIWAVIIVACIFALRAIQLRISRLPFRPLLFVAPRGLITILLFLSISPEYAIGMINKSLITQVIILTSLIMMVGLITNKRRVAETTLPEPEKPENVESVQKEE